MIYFYFFLFVLLIFFLCFPFHVCDYHCVVIFISKINKQNALDSFHDVLGYGSFLWVLFFTLVYVFFFGKYLFPFFNMIFF